MIKLTRFICLVYYKYKIDGKIDGIPHRCFLCQGAPRFPPHPGCRGRGCQEEIPDPSDQQAGETLPRY